MTNLPKYLPKSIEWHKVSRDSLPPFGVPVLVHLNSNKTINFKFEGSTTISDLDSRTFAVAVLCGNEDGFDETQPQFWSVMGLNEPSLERRTGYTHCVTSCVKLTSVRYWAHL